MLIDKHLLDLLGRRLLIKRLRPDDTVIEVVGTVVEVDSSGWFGIWPCDTPEPPTTEEYLEKAHFFDLEDDLIIQIVELSDDPSLSV